MVKQTIIHLSHKILLHNKKEQTIDLCNNLDEYQEDYAERQKAYLKKLQIHDSFYITSSPPSFIEV